MKDAAPQDTIYLSDYTPFGYVIDEVHLTFRLAPSATRVISRIAFRPNPEARDATFFLHGEELKLISARIDGAEVTPEVTAEGLTCAVPDAPFIWEAEVEIDPAGNTALEGLYMSNGMYCTQCEAEGFRKITYYPDRPDVMAPFSVRIEGDAPVLLSNGNPVSDGIGWAEWHDPWPKPAYLFALVAGHLVNHTGSFRTASGRDVALNIWVREGDAHKCAFGMEALKRSMTWDEEVYGREYDLDVFNIVAVDDFNMGAMENKGLNIFNSSCVLASPETSTDGNFERIEAIIAHEYFHNWTGNRITCRDWFQLCLKEGLTVFRDAQFTADMRSAPVKRIGDVIDLRARQFPEDQGPLSHPVRPDRYQEINNFYTATVYEKGAEVIGMLRRLVGDAGYAKGCALYFERHDGQACTIEDWLAVFEEATGRDLSQFKRWYTQSGTPRIFAENSYAAGTLTLTLRQSTPADANQSEKLPQVIPVAVALFAQDGSEMQPETMLELTEAEQSFTFEGLPEAPVVSLLRGFSAPVVLESVPPRSDRVFLFAHDTDPVNRWDAGNGLAREALHAMVAQGAAPDHDYLAALAGIVRDETLDPAYRALMLSLPSASEMAQMLHEGGTTPDPDAIHDAAETLRQALATTLQDDLARLYAAHQVPGPYVPDAGPAGSRALANATLALITRLDGGAQAHQQYEAAGNMTQQLAAYGCLLKARKGEAATAAFYDQWKEDRLVIDKWFSMQVMFARPEDTVATATALTGHPDFDPRNPNRFRATLGAMATHHAGFHRADGSGYAMLADWLITLDALNPQTTARMCTPFQTWRRYDAGRQAHAQREMERVLAQPNLSRDTTEMLSRIVKG